MGAPRIILYTGKGGRAARSVAHRPARGAADCRALIDSYLERLEEAQRQWEPWVEEIPIE